MTTISQKEKAEQFRQFHRAAPMLVLPNIWDAASARVLEMAGARAIATTSSGVAAALGYRDGQHISRDMLVEAIARITRVVSCPVTADIEAGFGTSIEEILRTVRAVIETGAVGFNIEDSSPQSGKTLLDISYQVELIKALRELAATLDIPFVINARTDVFLRASAKPEKRYELAVQRSNAYLQAGADCAYPIGKLKTDMIAELVQVIDGPINILGGPAVAPLVELAQLGVARVSLAGGMMRSTLGHLHTAAREILEQGTYTSMADSMLPNDEFEALFHV